MLIFLGNSRTFAVDAYGVFRGNSRSFSGSSTSSMFIFRGNSRAFGVAAVDAYGFCVVILVVFPALQLLRCAFSG